MEPIKTESEKTGIASLDYLRFDDEVKYELMVGEREHTFSPNSKFEDSPIAIEVELDKGSNHLMLAWYQVTVDTDS